MGSDGGPGVEVAGAVEAARASGLHIVLVGDEAQIAPHLGGNAEGVSDRITIRHTTQAITMHDAGLL